MISYTYSLPYLILTFSLLFLSWYWNKAKNKKQIELIAIFICLIFFGFRGFIGWDWQSYYQYYKGISPLYSDFFSLEYIEDFERIEPGFVFYMSLCKSVSSSYHFFVFISVIVDLSLLYFTLKRYSSNIIFSLAVFFSLSLAVEVDLMRNIKSMLIFLLSIKYILDKDWKRYYLLMCIGWLFHLSMIFYFPLYFILNRNFGKKTLAIILISSSLLYCLQLPVVSILIRYISPFVTNEAYVLMINSYLDSEVSGVSRGFTLGFIQHTLFYLLLILYYHTIISKNKSNLLFVNLFVVYYIFTVTFSDIAIVPERVGRLFEVSCWVLFPIVGSSFNIKNNAKIYLFLIIVLCLLRVSSSTSNIFYKYDNVLWGISSYEERVYIHEKYDDDFVVF